MEYKFITEVSEVQPILEGCLRDQDLLGAVGPKRRMFERYIKEMLDEIEGPKYTNAQAYVCVALDETGKLVGINTGFIVNGERMSDGWTVVTRKRNGVARSMHNLVDETGRSMGLKKKTITAETPAGICFCRGMDYAHDYEAFYEADLST